MVVCCSIRMADDFNVMRAALRGEWEAIINFYYCQQQPITVNDIIPVITVTGDTILHVCAQCRRKDVMKELLKVMPEDVRRTTNQQGNTILHEAVRTGIVDMVEVILEKEEGLIWSRNVHGETPIYWAAMYGHKKMLLFLVSYIIAQKGSTTTASSSTSMAVRRNDGSTILHAAVLGEFYDVAMEILELYPHLAWSRNENGATASHMLALSPFSFKSGTIYSYQYVGASPFFSPEKIAIGLYSFIPMDDYETNAASAYRSLQKCSFMTRCKYYFKSGIKWICRGFPVIRIIYKAKQKHTYVMQLVKLLLEKDSQVQQNYASDGRDPWKENNYNNLQFDCVKTTNKFTEKPLILATKMGIIELVKEIVQVFPESLQFVDEEAGKNVLHLVAEHRREYIMEWLRYMKKRDLANLVVGIDKEGNTALHAAAKLGDSKLWHIRGAMHHMQWECVWFERIKYLLPAHMATIKNSNNKTAKEVFSETHKEVLQNAEKWAKDLSNTCMLMSTLLATVMFTAAFTVPGGNDEETGLPVLLKTSDFPPFIQYAAFSLFFSLFSLGLFLNINTSRFNEEDFYIWLPLKTVAGITMLFDSVIFTISCFSQAYVLVTGWKFSVIITILDIAIAAIGFFFFVYLYLDNVLCFLRYLVDIVFI